MAGFGFGPESRNGLLSFGSATAALPLEPADEWTGTAGSGFSFVPSDPVRTTAKPACRLLVPPDQFFTDELIVGVAAAANNQSSMRERLGLSHVTFHLEGNTQEVSQPSYREFPDANGNPVSYLGWWATIKKPASKTGAMELYVEAVPSDTTMQSRVTGPHRFHAADVLHDLELEIAPLQPAITGQRYPTMRDAMLFIRSQAAANPRVTITQDDASLASWTNIYPFYTPDGYVTIEASVPVTFRKSGLATDATITTNQRIVAGIDGLWFKGSNITFDFEYLSEISNHAIKDNVFDGVTMTNGSALGRDNPWRKGPRPIAFQLRGKPWCLELNASELPNVCYEASLVRGGTFTRLGQDIFPECRCIVGTYVSDHNDQAFNDEQAAFNVTYSGGEAVATLAREGAVDPASVDYVLTLGSAQHRFNVGNSVGHYAGTSGDGYTMQDVVNWLNGFTGVTAILDSDKWRASAGTLPTLRAQGFPATDIKDTVLQIYTAFDRHGDWFQQRIASVSENIIAYDNIAINLQTQNLFIASTADARDFLFFNNAFWNDPQASPYFDHEIVTSQLGNTGSAHSHVVIAHCTNANQGLLIRTDISGFEMDSYCLIANNTCIRLDFAGAVDADPSIKGNHVHSGENIAGLDGTSGGDELSLFTDAAAGDFAPQGSLAANLNSAVVALDLNRSLRVNNTAAGAVG